MYCTLLMVVTVLYALFFQDLTSATIYQREGFTVVFTCQYNDTIGVGVLWEYRSSLSSGQWITLTANTDKAEVPNKDRISITGDFNAGQYKLNIIDLQRGDSGYYRCRLGSGQGDGSPQEIIVIVGPTSVKILNTTTLNKLIGTEGQTLQVQCAATGGSPPPDVKILIGGSQANTGTQAVSYTIQTLDRSHDGQTVTCQAGYTSINDFPLSDTSELYLNLRPLVPVFNPASVSVIENDEFDIACTSTGSRPAAVYTWEIGGVDITTSSQITSSTQDPSSNTFTVVSRLTYTITKDHNGDSLICKAINLAVPGGVPAAPITVDVKYPPTVTLGDRTVTAEASLTVLTCTADGNPDNYTFYEWTHESLQGTLIRTLPGNNDGTLTLPNVNSSLRYQNTGRYNCSVGNGIPDKNTKRTGSMVFIVQAPPEFAVYNNWAQGGERGKPASLSVYVYSIPTPSTVSWYRGNTLVSGSGYTVSTSQTSVQVMYHGLKVTMDGYRVTLNINNVKDSDFTTYRVFVGNDRGSSEETLKFVPFSIPETPTNLAEVNTTEHTITIEWTPGFDGGYKQIFVIEYRVTNTNNFQETVVSRNISHLGSHFFTITALESGTKYDIRIFSRNVRGLSPPSKIMTISTICKCSNSESSSNSLIGVAVGLSTVTVVSLVVNGVFVFRTINGKNTPKKRDSIHSSLNKTARSEVYYNIAGNVDDKDAQDTIIQISTYEELGSKDKPNEYEELNKAPGDVSNVHQALNYETLGATDQPNVYDDLEAKASSAYILSQPIDKIRNHPTYLSSYLGTSTYGTDT